MLCAFIYTYIIRTPKEWNALTASVFPDQYNLVVYKTRVNMFFLARHAPSSTIDRHFR